MPSQPTKLAVGLLAACCLCIGTAAPAAFADDTTHAANSSQTASYYNDFTVYGDGIANDQLSLGVNDSIDFSTSDVSLPQAKPPTWVTTSDASVASGYVSSTQSSTIQFGNYVRTVIAVKGVISGHSAGKATLTFHIGDKTSTLDVEVKTIPVESVSWDSSSMEMHVGDSHELTPTVSPSNATNKAVTYTSSNPEIASVNAGGTLQAHKAGTTEITAQAGGKSAVLSVTVNNRPVDLLGILGDGIKDGKVVLPQNGQIQLKPHILPENATNKTPAWNSSNNDVITVSPDGLVIAHKAGNATVTLTVDGKKANVDVTVKPLVEFVKIDGKNVADGNLKMTVLDSEPLTATVSPENAFDKTVKWESTDTRKLTVDQNGVIHAKEAGQATVVARSGLKFVSPENAFDKTVKWESTDTRKLTVDQNGVIHAKEAGQATVVARSGLKFGELKVTIGFRDVSNETPHYQDIQWMANNNISTGWADGTYRGMDTVKRQDMAAFLRREAALRNITDARNWTPTQADWKRFADVNKSTPHAEDILWLAHAGIATGYKHNDGTSTYGGMIPVYRQDMAAFLERIAKLDNKASGITPKTDFTDVTDKTPHYKEIEWLGGSGIAQGYRNENGTWRFGGMIPTYRQDMAAFIQRLNALLEK